MEKVWNFFLFFKLLEYEVTSIPWPPNKGAQLLVPFQQKGKLKYFEGRVVELSPLSKPTKVRILFPFDQDKLWYQAAKLHDAYMVVG